MWWRRSSENGGRAVKDCGRTDGIYRLAISVDKVLRVRLNGPHLGYKELCVAIDCLASFACARSARKVIFDFELVRVIDPPWAAVLALVIHYVKRSMLQCHISALHGQPAAVVQLFCCNSEIRKLISESGDWKEEESVASTV